MSTLEYRIRAINNQIRCHTELIMKERDCHEWEAELILYHGIASYTIEYNQGSGYAKIFQRELADEHRLFKSSLIKRQDNLTTAEEGGNPKDLAFAQKDLNELYAALKDLSLQHTARVMRQHYNAHKEITLETMEAYFTQLQRFPTLREESYSKKIN